MQASSLNALTSITRLIMATSDQAFQTGGESNTWPVVLLPPLPPAAVKALKESRLSFAVPVLSSSPSSKYMCPQACITAPCKHATLSEPACLEVAPIASYGACKGTK